MTRPLSEPVKRSTEIEEPSNLYLIHPISSWLVPRFAAWGIHPNAVSLTGMACGILAGLAYTQYRHPAWAVAGFVLMIAWHVMDGADGQLARLTRRQSESGKILDGICDYVTFISVYVGLALVLSRQHGAFVWPLVAAAGACHAVQAAAYEVQRQDYNFWGLDRASAALTLPESGAGLGRQLYRLYARIQFAATGADLARRQRLAALIAARPDLAPAIRQSYRQIFAPRVRLWALLCANYRTFGIFLFAVCGRPLLWFVFEIVVLSVTLGLLLAGQPAAYRRLFQQV